MLRGPNKLGKYNYLRDLEKLAPHLPETSRMGKEQFETFIEKYQSVILKPNGGGGGAGVIMVKALENDRYVIHEGKKRVTIQGLEHTYARLRKRIGSRFYIIQRRVDLATVNRCPFDVRVIVQRRRKSPTWKVTGELAKVAGKGFIVTNNSRSKGKLLPLRTGIRRSSIRSLSTDAIISNLHRVALTAANRLNEYYPRQRIFGLDMGLDQSGHPWIIEMNKDPSMSHFLKMKNYKMYNRIIKYKQS